MTRFPACLLSVLACASLGACSVEQPKLLKTVILRDNQEDAGALAAVGVAAGAPPVRDVSCALRTNGADKLPSCGFRLHPGHAVFGPYLPLAPGAYEAQFTFAPTADCTGGTVLLDIVTVANNFKPLAQQTLKVRGAQSVRLAFTEDRALADGAPMELRTRFPGRPGKADCVVLSDVKVLAR